jgi:hypothetical protein
MRDQRAVAARIDVFSGFCRRARRRRNEFFSACKCGFAAAGATGLRGSGETHGDVLKSRSGFGMALA